MSLRYNGTGLYIVTMDRFYKHGLTLIPARLSNCIHYKVWGEITYPFPNLCPVRVWKWINNFIIHFTEHVFSYAR